MFFAQGGDKNDGEHKDLKSNMRLRVRRRRDRLNSLSLGR